MNDNRDAAAIQRIVDATAEALQLARQQGLRDLSFVLEMALLEAVNEIGRSARPQRCGCDET